MAGFIFKSPPGWPIPPAGWVPPEGWTADPSWPTPPPDWQFWVAAEEPVQPAAVIEAVTPPEPEPFIESDFAPNNDALLAEYQTQITQLEGTVAYLEKQLSETQGKLQAKSSTPETNDDVIELDDEKILQEVGIYRYHHPLENSEEFRKRLHDLQDRIKETVKAGDAVLASEMFTFNNSLAKGRKMTSDLSKLMLRAYNAEADNSVRSLRAGNVITAKKRVEASVASIAKLGAMMEMRVNPDYHALRLEEIELTADFLMKVQEEKEAAREERERLREERKAEQELAAERERLNKEKSHYLNAIQALRDNGDETAADELAAKVAKVDEAIAQNDFRAANIRAGYVYVISNRGSFGDTVVKIGLTRRLEPLDRVRELGDASVPFPFDVHAIYFSDDAVTLETELHQAFTERRVNHVNSRREFFFATPEDVRIVLAEKVGNLLEFTEDPESTEYLQSKKYWPTAVTA